MTLRSRFFAATYDRSMAKVDKAGLSAHREAVLAEASGRVLEIGAGTGSNLPFYGPGVESLTMTEPEVPMLRRLERKVRAQALGATVLRAPAEISPSRTTRSTPPSRPWCSAAWMTSPALCGSCAGCCDPVAVSCLSNTSGPTTLSSPASRTV